MFTIKQIHNSYLKLTSRKLWKYNLWFSKTYHNQKFVKFFKRILFILYMNKRNSLNITWNLSLNNSNLKYRSCRISGLQRVRFIWFWSHLKSNKTPLILRKEYLLIVFWQIPKQSNLTPMVLIFCWQMINKADIN